MCVSVCIWKSEVDLDCLPVLVSPSFLRQSLFGCIGWLTSFRSLPVFASPVLWLWVHSTAPQLFAWVLGSPTHVLMLAQEVLSPSHVLSPLLWSWPIGSSSLWIWFYLWNEEIGFRDLKVNLMLHDCVLICPGKCAITTSFPSAVSFSILSGPVEWPVCFRYHPGHDEGMKEAEWASYYLFHLFITDVHTTST